MPSVAARRRAWTRERVIAAFLAYRSAVGRWPTADGCTPSRLRELGKLEDLAAWQQHDLPYPATVYRLFGSWQAAIQGAESQALRIAADVR